VAFYDCIWLVEGAVKPRPTHEEQKFCTNKAHKDVQLEIEEQLHRKLLNFGKARQHRVLLEDVMEASGFFSKLGWEEAGMPVDDPEMHEFLVQYISSVMEETELLRQHRGKADLSKADAKKRKVAKELSNDIDFLLREACKCYVIEHHAIAAQALGWHA
jgi:hypothetical protein